MGSARILVVGAFNLYVLETFVHAAGPVCKRVVFDAFTHVEFPLFSLGVKTGASKVSKIALWDAIVETNSAQIRTRETPLDERPANTVPEIAEIHGDLKRAADDVNAPDFVLVTT